ncbi:ABC transporter permease [Guptibacillus algicola]|uniref:ABC transporter permease n=1 Tax=Guptibacillus algicola TaxID=225844 RepID=UPI001CD7717C|nr:ABC transporter permease subunit [Alkalihalobacillus algicola]MCA0989091.1 ABC transporter permease subunit [Alkalihalobacillus algicola]
MIKNPMFLIGMIVLLLLFGGSVYYSIAYDDHIPQTFLLYNEDGNLIDKAPLPPTHVPPFGTDQLGFHLFQQIIIGAKYTIGIAILVACMRIALSFVAGVISGTFTRKISRVSSGMVDAMQYIPISLLSYFILRGVLMENGMEGTFQYTFYERAIFEVIILTAVAVPTTTVLISNETNSLWQKSYIEGARILGGSKISILFRHILPHLWPRMTIIFLQQLINVFILLLHLGLLKLFFGGTLFSPDPELGDEYRSVSSEWSGLIGSTYEYLPYNTWIPLIPILFFVLVIFSVNIALEGYKQTINRQAGIKRRSKQKKRTIEKDASASSFHFINEEDYKFQERKAVNR